MIFPIENEKMREKDILKGRFLIPSSPSLFEVGNVTGIIEIRRSSKIIDLFVESLTLKYLKK